ncbi:MAG: TraB/GumN family protein [Methanobrevibacter millerae]|uniref:TraB/GumN family protein n=1 Tax=Methanobrevibacter millerae TaxID=230361 RepID=A0A8T3VL02_9EURY|nr:TraB/GumN family protein [Methanobrevibacter millerae]
MKRECLTIIGTAHVSAESVEEVKDAIYELQPDRVAIELDLARYTKLKNSMMGIEEDDSISVTKIIKENKVGLFLLTTVLSYFQSKIGDEVDVAPGSEMVGAIEAAEDLGIPIALIDRNINITLERALNRMSFFEKIKFLIGILTTDTDDEEIDIEDLKNPDNLEDLLEMFKDEAPGIYDVLVHERDAYLAGSLLRIPEDKVVAVVGAGHQPGINAYLDNPETIPPLEELNKIVDKKGISWTKIILALIPILFVVIFFLAFINGINITWNLYQFVGISMLMGFLGSILSGSKIQSALVGGLVAPLTIIHPLLAAGWFSGLTEAKYRKVRQRDIRSLAHIESIKDLWHNNIFRILLVVVGTNLAVSIATLVILPSQVFIPLFMQLFGG